MRADMASGIRMNFPYESSKKNKKTPSNMAVPLNQSGYDDSVIGNY
jgi:hypothetical protein